MRAARLLQILLLLQNRGRQTAGQLAEELEVAPRTILRDVDAMTEAGLPIIVFQGNRGGIELGFNYRTRLTGLARDEAEALGLILSAQTPMIDALELGHAASQARAKLIESLPDGPRQHAAGMVARFRVGAEDPSDDARIRAMAKAVRGRNIVKVRFTSETERVIHPIALELDTGAWRVRDGRADAWIPISDWGRLNISSKQFAVDEDVVPGV